MSTTASAACNRSSAFSPFSTRRAAPLTPTTAYPPGKCLHAVEIKCVVLNIQQPLINPSVPHHHLILLLLILYAPYASTHQAGTKRAPQVRCMVLKTVESTSSHPSSIHPSPHHHLILLSLPPLLLLLALTRHVPRVPLRSDAWCSTSSHPSGLK